MTENNIAPLPQRRTLPALGLRVITGLILGGAVIALLLVAPIWGITIFATACAALGFFEYSRMMPGLAWPETILGVILCAALLPITYSGGMTAALPFLVLAVVLSAFFCMLGAPGLAIEKASRLTFGYVYVGGALACLIGLLEIEQGRYWLLFLLVLVAVVDMSGYFVGSLLGKHKLAPRISPNKTWEGVLGGLLGAAACGALASIWLTLPGPSAWWWLIIVSLLVAVSAIVGDLFESAIKRISGMKDSGKILPGHGGLLDRLDGYLLALPAMLLILYIWPRLWSILS